MIDRERLPELQTFIQVENELVFKRVPQLGPLVVPNGNSSAPVHRWFHYKEAFSANLLEHVISSRSISTPPNRNLVLLDPYCGVGTGLLSAQLSGRKIDAVGIECNPLSAFLAAAKLNWHLINVERFRTLSARLLQKKFTGSPSLPELTSIKTGRCISKYMARQILQYKSEIGRTADGAERDALLVGLAAAIEPVSRIRRDGRALRIVSKRKVQLREVLATKWEAIAKDVELLKNAGAEAGMASVVVGDGRNPEGVGIQAGTVDLIFTSPPYPNNIDYNEVYKLEMWLLGHVETAASFLALRRMTFRSHPTCNQVDESS